MSLETLLSQIDEYVDDSKRYAIALEGEWGSGKTHFINTALRKHLRESRHIKLIRVSLFGIRSADDLYERLTTTYFHLNADKDSRLKRGAAQVGRTGVQAVSSFAANTLKQCNIQISIGPQAITTLLGRNIIVVFDDCERTADGVADTNLLGAINDLVEGIGCKVILVSNDISRIDSLLREKLIWKTLRYSPEPEELFDAVLSHSLSGFETPNNHFLEACRMGAIQARCDNARAMIKSAPLLKMILSSPILSDDQFTPIERERVVTDCARLVLLTYSNKNPSTPIETKGSITQSLPFSNYYQTDLIDRFFSNQQNPSPQEIDDALSNYLHFCYPSTPRDRCLKELVSKQSELEYLNDADVEKISSDLSSHLKEHVVNDPDLLWDALILNWIFFDLGFPQALTMSTARDAAENSLDANSSAFLEAFRDIIQLQRPLSPDDPLTKMLTNLVNYCQKKQEQSLVSEIMSEMDKTDALDRGSYLYQKIACDEVIDTNVLFSLPPAAIAKCFEKGSAPSQVSIIKLIRQIKEKDSLGQGETEWLVKLEKQFDELNVSSRMGKGRLSVMKNAIQEIIEKDDAMRAAKGTK